MGGRLSQLTRVVVTCLTKTQRPDANWYVVQRTIFVFPSAVQEGRFGEP